MPTFVVLLMWQAHGGVVAFILITKKDGINLEFVLKFQET